MAKATEPAPDFLRSCSGLASHWFKDIELESVIVVWASVFALKITHAQFLVWCIYATVVFCNDELAFTLLDNSLKKHEFSF